MRLETYPKPVIYNVIAIMAAEYLDLNVKMNSAESHFNQHYSLCESYKDTLARKILELPGANLKATSFQ